MRPLHARVLIPFLICLSLISCHKRVTLSPEEMRARLISSTWVGTDSDGDRYVFHFQPDGTLHYTSPTGSYTNGTWKLEGDRIYFEMNQRYSEYQGTFSGNRMAGKAWNVRGKKWTWSVHKV